MQWDCRRPCEKVKSKDGRVQEVKKWYAWVARGHADGEEINVKFYKILAIIHDLS